MAYETLLFEQRDGISFLTLNRPEKLNALNRQAIEELRDGFERVAADASARVVILTGAGEKAFAAGADIAELSALTPVEAEEVSRRGQDLFDRIENLGKPVIAAVHGYALGGGCELAMACTLRVASEDARLGLPEVKLGLIPGYGGTQRLPRLVGKGKALEMVLTGEPVTAEEALRIGLVHRVVPRRELMEAAEVWARKILANSPVAVRFALRALHQAGELPCSKGQMLEAALFGLACATEDMKEGTRAFLEKRAPKFSGR